MHADGLNFGPSMMTAFILANRMGLQPNERGGRRAPRHIFDYTHVTGRDPAVDWPPVLEVFIEHEAASGNPAFAAAMAERQIEALSGEKDQAQRVARLKALRAKALTAVSPPPSKQESEAVALLARLTFDVQTDRTDEGVALLKSKSAAPLLRFLSQQRGKEYTANNHPGPDGYEAKWRSLTQWGTWMIGMLEMRRQDALRERNGGRLPASFSSEQAVIAAQLKTVSSNPADKSCR